jgi:hypothetical protein
MSSRIRSSTWIIKDLWDWDNTKNHEDDMALSTRTFRAFVSSTFSDLKAERNALQEKVFRRLRDFSAVHGCHFQAIVLRWEGARNFSSISQKVLYNV